jgi:hypothetical protein
LIAALALGWWLDRQRLTQPAVVPAPPPVAAAETGRWQLVIGKDGSQILVDTATGKTWTYSSYQWNFQGTPK